MVYEVQRAEPLAGFVVESLSDQTGNKKQEPSTTLSNKIYSRSLRTSSTNVLNWCLKLKYVALRSKNYHNSVSFHKIW